MIVADLDPDLEAARREWTDLVDLIALLEAGADPAAAVDLLIRFEELG